MKTASVPPAKCEKSKKLLLCVCIYERRPDKVRRLGHVRRREGVCRLERVRRLRLEQVRHVQTVGRLRRARQKTFEQTFVERDLQKSAILDHFSITVMISLGARQHAIRDRSFGRQRQNGMCVRECSLVFVSVRWCSCCVGPCNGV